MFRCIKAYQHSYDLIYSIILIIYSGHNCVFISGHKDSASAISDWNYEVLFTRSAKNFVRQTFFSIFDVSQKFFIVRRKFFTLKMFLKQTKMRSA